MRGPRFWGASCSGTSGTWPRPSRPETVTRLNDFLSFVSRMPLTLELTEAQNFLFALMQDRFPAVAARAAQDPKAQTLAKQLVALMETVHFSPVRYLKLLA